MARVSFTGPRLALSGARAGELFDDTELAALAEVDDLEVLELHHQPMTRLPPLPAHLHTLWLDNASRLTSLAGIERLYHLTSLTLAHLPSLDLARELSRLAELPELATLALAGDQLHTLPDALAELPSLLSLRISLASPRLDFAQVAHVLARIPSLRTLVFHPQRAMHYPEELGLLPQLTTLALGRALSLPPAIEKLRALTSLALASAPLVVLPDELCACTALEVLDLRSSQLVRLPEELGKLVHLRVLDLDGTQLSSLPASIGELHALRDLRLLAKRKVSVPESLFTLSLERFTGRDELRRRIVLRPPPPPDTDRVYVTDPARIPDELGTPRELHVTLPHFTGELPQLAQLPQLQRCELDVADAALPGVLRSLAQGSPFLRELALHGTRAHLPDELGRLKGLRTLALNLAAGSEPLAVPEAIGALVHLERLAASGDAITSLPRALGELANLTVLAIQRCGNLVRLPAELAHCPALVELTIAGARIAVGAELARVLGAIPMLRSLHLGHLPVEDLAAVLRALAGTRLERLHLGDLVMLELPEAIGALTQLRWIALPPDVIDRANVKTRLPRGRWRKGKRGDTVWYERDILAG